MRRIAAAAKNQFVWLDKPLPEDEDVPPEPKTLDPNWAWVSIQPSPPGPYDENKVSHVVHMDYHPDMTLNTRLTTEDGRQLWVRGMQDVETKHVEHILFCEEVLTP